jgi:hypothetical protein
MSNHNIVAFRYGSIIKNLLMREDEEKATDRGAIITGYRKLNATFDKLHILFNKNSINRFLRHRNYWHTQRT